MIRRLIDLTLIALILVGAYRSWQSSQERAHLKDTYERLSRITGSLPIEDPSKIHILALKTGDPLQFAWRIYMPPNGKLHVSDNRGSSSSSWNSNATEFIARVRFRENEDGKLEIYEHMHFSSGLSSIGDRKLINLLLGRWNQLQVEQLGAPDIAVLDTDENAVLLRLSFPDNLAAEARKTLSSPEANFHIPVIYELKLSPDPSTKPRSPAKPLPNP